MQRRLTIALIGIALASIVFVGAGVLGFAQVGAEREARDAVSRQLEALAQVAENSRSLDRLGPAIQQIGDAFNIRSVRLGVLGEDGHIQFTRSRTQAAGNPIEISAGGAETLLDGEPLIEKEHGRLIGIRLFDIETQRGDPVVVVIESNIATIGDRARGWFLLSGAIVLVVSALIAWWLARRFTAPVRFATQTTAAIAAGDLSARMPVNGDDELAELGSSINRMASELERGKAAEQQFLLSVSHDLRTPLTAISGYAEALEDGAATDHVRVGQIIRNHADRLERLVGDLLDLAKLDAHQFRFHVDLVDAGAVADQVALGQAPDAAQRGLRLDHDTKKGVWIQADADRLAQIIGNLIDNAAKYAESHIEVSVDRADDGADGNGTGTGTGSRPTAVIIVRDDGPGIHSDDLPHVFERLYVTQQRPVRAESSSGLGLAIVRELVAAMGGHIDARSIQGEGTEMRVVFPLAQGPIDESSSAPVGL